MHIRSETILNAIQDAGLFVAPAKENRPTLRSVLVTYTPPGDGPPTLRLVATDSYGLVRVTLPIVTPPGCDDDFHGEEWECLVNWDDISRASKMFDKHATLEVLAPADSQAFGLSDGSATLQPRAMDDQYPNWQGLWPDESAMPGTEMIAIAPFQLARLAKFKSETKNTPVRWRFSDHLKPAVFKFGATIDGIVMPVRCNDL